MSELLNPRRPAKACQMEGKHLAINGGTISLQLASLLLLKSNQLVERPVSASIYIYIYIYTSIKTFSKNVEGCRDGSAKNYRN